jgi:hypothetical protein
VTSTKSTPLVPSFSPRDLHKLCLMLRRLGNRLGIGRAKEESPARTQNGALSSEVPQ